MEAAGGRGAQGWGGWGPFLQPLLTLSSTPMHYAVSGGEASPDPTGPPHPNLFLHNSPTIQLAHPAQHPPFSQPPHF